MSRFYVGNSKLDESKINVTIFTDCKSDFLHRFFTCKLVSINDDVSQMNWVKNINVKAR